MIGFRNGRLTTLTEREELPSNQVWSLYGEHDGALWVGTSNGVAKLDGGHVTPFAIGKTAKESVVYALTKDHDGNIWAGTLVGGLVRITNGTATTLRQVEGLPDDEVRGLTVDREGSLWVGTQHGLARLRDPAFLSYIAKQFVPATNGPIVAAPDSGLYIAASSGGLWRWKPGEVPVREEAVGDEIISGLSPSQSGGLWLTGGRLPLGYLAGGRLRKFSREDGFPGGCDKGCALAVIEDRKGDVWIGTNSAGLVRFNGSQFSALTKKDGLPANSVYSLLEDTRNRLWIGTDKGLSKFENGKLSTVSLGEGSGNPLVLSIAEDREKVLWVATASGLGRLDHGQAFFFRARHGLSDETILQVVDDGQGYFWLTGGRGISRVKKADLDDVAAGRRSRFNSQLYGTKNGLPSDECATFAQPAAVKDGQGSLWFSTRSGLARLDLANVSTNRVEPLTAIKEVSVNGQPLAPATPLRIGASHDRVEIHYAGLSLARPERNRFRYQLEGYDRDWVDGGVERVATYTHLPPGNFVFPVIGSNNDGVWDRVGSSARIYVEPHLYQTWWFYLASLGLTTYFAWQLYQFRLRQVQSRYKLVLDERNRMARTIHDTLMQGFAGVSWQLEAISRQFFESPEETKQRLDTVLTHVDECLTEARHTITYIRLPALEGGGLASAVNKVGTQLARDADVEFALRLSGEERASPITVEGNLYAVGREAFTNAIRHGHPKCIHLEICYLPDCVRLTVTDDGKGFEPYWPPAYGHWGIVGMRERVAQMNGQFDLISQPGAGTTVLVMVPIPAVHPDDLSEPPAVSKSSAFTSGFGEPGTK